MSGYGRRRGRQDGQCPECGMFDPRSAPTSCVRDAFAAARQAAEAAGALHDVEPADAIKSALRYDDLWSMVAERMIRGGVRGDRFYVFTAYDDGEPLEPAQHLRPEYLTVTAAREAAETQLPRYPHVWLVTVRGAWRVTSSATGQNDVAGV